MEIGDLVELSSAGNSLKQNSKVYGKIGLIVRFAPDQGHPIKIDWLGFGIYPMKRYEIKKVRGIK